MPSSESYGRVPVPRWASKRSKASLSSARSFSTSEFSALASAVAPRCLAPCGLPFADPRGVEPSTYSSVVFASWELCLSCSIFTSAASYQNFLFHFCISAGRAATYVACCCASARRTGAEQAKKSRSAVVNPGVGPRAGGDHSHYPQTLGLHHPRHPILPWCSSP